MKTKFLLLFLSLTILEVHFCGGMDALKKQEVKKKSSKSHIVKKTEKKDEVIRRKSASEVEAMLKESSDAGGKRRTFSLFRKKAPLKTQSKSADGTHGDILPAQSGAKTPHASVAVEEASLVDALGAETAVALAVLSREVAKPAQEVATGNEPSDEKLNKTEVQLPKLNARKQLFHTSKEIVVQPQVVDKQPEMNGAQKILARKPSLLRVMLKRSGRDSQTEFTAQEYLGQLGKGALLPNLSPGQSPRSEDAVSESTHSAPGSKEGTPRNEDTSSPRVDDDSGDAHDQSLENK